MFRVFYWEISNVLFSFAHLSFFPFYIVVDHRFMFCFTLFHMILGVLFLSTLKHFHIYVRPPTSLIIDSLPPALKWGNKNSEAEWRWVDLSSEWQPEKAPRHLKLFPPESSKTLGCISYYLNLLSCEVIGYACFSSKVGQQHNLNCCTSGMLMRRRAAGN